MTNFITNQWVKWVHRIAVTTLVLCALGSRVVGDEVRIVLSSKAQPYVLAFRGAREALIEAGHDPSPVMLETLQAEPGVLAEDTASAYVAIGTDAASWLSRQERAAGRLVYCMVASPAEHGLVGAGAPHGVSMRIPIPEQFQLIARALPEARSVGMIYRRDDEQSRRNASEAEQWMPTGWNLHLIAIEDYGADAEAIKALYDLQIDVVWTAPDPAVYDKSLVRSLLLKGLRDGTPVYGFSIPFVRAGALVGVGIDPQVHGGQAGALTATLLRNAPQSGAGDGQSPSEAGRGGVGDTGQPLAPKYQTVVNLIAAKSLNTKLPEQLVREVDLVLGQD